MKISKKNFILTLFLLNRLGFSQGFVNLNFENATIIPTSGFSVDASAAIPGWTAYVGGTPQTSVVYNTIPLGAAQVTLQSPDNYHGSIPYPYPNIEGHFFMMLWGQYNPSQNNTSTNTAAIGQTGQISLTAKSLSFWGTLGGMQATFNGQPLDFIQTGGTTNYNIYSADITAYAGQSGELRFENKPYGGGIGGPSMLDNILFSPDAIPEPSAFALSAFGGLLLGWRVCRK